MAKRKGKGCLSFLTLILGFGVAGFWWYSEETKPTSPGPNVYVRLQENSGIERTMSILKSHGIVKNPTAMRAYAVINRLPRYFKMGTYELKPGLTPEQIFARLQSPVKQMVRMPETNWARRSANLLEKANVTPAKEYLEAIARPQDFAKFTKAPLPKSGTLEGYLFPDTYDFPPDLGAKGVVERQIQAFEKKVVPLVKNPENLRRTLIIASLVELEVAVDEERAVVAGVIENRLMKKMPLQIDATVNYALQEWRPLSLKDLKFESPYNTYVNKGLPPGPICSPSLASIKAALKPKRHNYLYYVALPNRTHLFSSTFDDHRRNIAKRRAALKALETSSQ